MIKLVAKGRGRWRLVPQEEGTGQMKWTVGTSEYETVQQYVGVVQRDQFVAVAAGVFIGQHCTRACWWQTCTDVVVT